MSEPEIARRCSHCGVSLRQTAMFCPQCGQQIGPPNLPDTVPTNVELADARLTNTDLADTQLIDTKLPDTQISDTPIATAPIASVPTVSAPITEAPIRENPSSSRPAATHPSSPTSVAGNVRERVEKIRHVSSVVIDQAAYDPSLRFILVAAVIFVLFLILLILSKAIG